MASSDIKITNQNELEKWLDDKPIEWSQAIAARAALRSLPAVLIEIQNPELIIQVFRANFISWAASKYPAHDMIRAAGDAASLAVDASSYAYASSSASLTASSTAVASASSYAANTASFAASASAYAASLAPAASVTSSSAYAMDAADQFWRGVSTDATWLDEKYSDALINTPLWPIEVSGEKGSAPNYPEWAMERFREFVNSKQGEILGWRKLLDWYQSLLPGVNNNGSLFGEKVDIEIATQPDKFWEQDTDFILENIAKLVGGKPFVIEDIIKEKSGSGEQPTEIETPQPREYEPVVRDEVPTHSDEPTRVDQLDRWLFAQSLVDLINKVQQEGLKDGFAVHLHAPWGAGKTSILYMMEDIMTSNDRKNIKANSKQPQLWSVVKFNAWEHERRNPPWWPMMEAIKRDCSDSIKKLAGPIGLADYFSCRYWRLKRRRDVLNVRWYFWKLTSDWMPLMVFFFFVPFVISYFYFENGFDISKFFGDGWLHKAVKIIEELVKLIVIIGAALSLFVTASRAMVFGSKDNEKYYQDLSKDRLGPVKKLFKSMIKSTQMPVCIFIDDLDRCHADFVVDLLEGIQTSFRDKNVAYVIAADKAWIRSAFETRYESFAGNVGDAGQPLGYLFLEKIFQISTPIPGMGEDIRQTYWDKLIDDRANASTLTDDSPQETSTEKLDSDIEAITTQLQQSYPEGLTSEKADVFLEKNDSAAARAAVTRALDKSSKEKSENEHLLAEFVPIVSDNPRVMKRMINAFSMRRTIRIIEKSTIPMNILARWTIIEQRYPALADLLVEQPDLIECFVKDQKKKDLEDLPQEFVVLAKSGTIAEIITKDQVNSLSPKVIREMTKGMKG